MVRWRVENVHGRNNELIPLNSVELFNMVRRPSMMGTALHRRN